MVKNKKPKSTKKDIIKEFQHPIKIEGLTTMEVSKRLSMPKETARLRLEHYESDGLLESIFFGKTKIYGLRKTIPKKKSSQD